MIVCGWCEAATAPARCSHCGRDPVQPWFQRNQMPPEASDASGGRPTLDAGKIRQRLLIARKELGPDATNAALAEHLGIDPRTLSRWKKLAG